MRFLIFLITLHTLSAEPLVVGMELSYPPFETVDEAGSPSGLSVDLAKSLGLELGREVVIKNIPYIGLIPALKNGQLDLIISSMTVTDERGRSIDFSDPYMSIGLALLVPKNSPVQNIQDLDNKGKKVAVKMGTTGQLYAQKNLKAASVIILDKESSAVMEVIQGKVDGFLYDQLSIYNNWQKNQDTTRALFNPIQKEYWAIGLRKGNQALQAQVNAFLKKFRAEGGFENLTNRYLKEEKNYFATHNIPFSIEP